LLALQSEGESSAFNLGNGNGYSVDNVTRAARRVTGETNLVADQVR